MSTQSRYRGEEIDEEDRIGRDVLEFIDPADDSVGVKGLRRVYSDFMISDYVYVNYTSFFLGISMCQRAVREIRVSILTKIYGTGSVGLGMELLDVKELIKGQAFVQDPECDSRDRMGGEVRTDKVVKDPVAIQSPL